MRIISGRFRGRHLSSPPPEITRPTSDRAREAAFSALTSRLSSWNDVTFLDAFAGSGAFGLEALSRGAKFVVFAEKNKIAAKIIAKSLSSLSDDLTMKSVLYGDVLKMPKAKTAFDVIYLDAPYRKGLTAPALEYLAKTGWIGEESLIIAETETGEDFTPPEGFTLNEVKTYGRASLNFLSYNKSLK